LIMIKTILGSWCILRVPIANLLYESTNTVSVPNSV
jgi:hypothetical protein